MSIHMELSDLALSRKMSDYPLHCRPWSLESKQSRFSGSGSFAWVVGSKAFRVRASGCLDLGAHGFTLRDLEGLKIVRIGVSN